VVRNSRASVTRAECSRSDTETSGAVGTSISDASVRSKKQCSGKQFITYGIVPSAHVWDVVLGAENPRRLRLTEPKA
jgi:hypothetical protein